MKTASSIEAYIIATGQWQDGLILLHEIIVSTGLTGSIKWGVPVYSYEKKNILGLAAFKKHLAIWFYQGALLHDPYCLLTNAQEDKTKALRQMRFNSMNQIDPAIVTSYVIEAIENHKAGKEITVDKNKPVIIPEELAYAFSEDPEIERCFNYFSMAKKREFAQYISYAKRKETRLSRLDKIVPLILENNGLNDKYKK